LSKYVLIGDTEYQEVPKKMIGYLSGFMLLALGFLNWMPKVIEHKKHVKNNLENAEKDVRELSGLLPICASCKKIRDDQGYWSQIELYISKHSNADFSHSICPVCADKIYPDFKSAKD